MSIMSISSIAEAIEDVKVGKFIIIVDDKDRENEGDLALAADKVTTEAINFMTLHARGLICMPITGKRLDELRIPLMVGENTSKFSTAFTISVEAKHKVSTGISAADRAETVKAILNPNTKAEDLARPGHMFPLRARETGLYPAGVICEILNEDGSMARLPQLELLSERHGIKIITVSDLITYRHRYEKLVHRVAEAKLPTRYGEFTAIAYKSDIDPDEHLALVMGDISTDEPVLVRVHSECITGDVADEGRGVFLYMRQEGRGIGFHNKIRAYALQDKGLDTVEANLSLGFDADLRDYGIGAQILADLGLHQIRLFTNNPKKVIGLEAYGLKVVETVPILTTPNPYNRYYLETKQKKLGHHLQALGGSDKDN